MKIGICHDPNGMFCGYCLFLFSYGEINYPHPDGKREMGFSYLGCAKCGRQIEVMMDGNYNKAIPPFWKLVIIPTPKEPHNPIRFVLCPDCQNSTTLSRCNCPEEDITEILKRIATALEKLAERKL